jgi:hypothetical protein
LALSLLLLLSTCAQCHTLSHGLERRQVVDLIHELLDLVLKLLILLFSFLVYLLYPLLFLHQLANLLVETTKRGFNLRYLLSQGCIFFECLGKQSLELLSTGLPTTELPDRRGS